MSIPCACGGIRARLTGVAGRQVWRGGWHEANIPTHRVPCPWLPPCPLLLSTSSAGLLRSGRGRHRKSVSPGSPAGVDPQRPHPEHCHPLGGAREPRVTTPSEHKPVSPHLSSLLPRLLPVQAVWPGSNFQELRSRYPIWKDRRGERFLFCLSLPGLRNGNCHSALNSWPRAPSGSG